ncbi:cytochrome c oxidase assembly protein [Metabacillus endolithicus]|uniref:Cytochrome c oxidase assembly protein n=1 Tax=Metabacillus endolithicus TaxID=1535204 RepID=A0ABW5C6F5_9BACI|nr:cytochrome c oxidase assembly protein [Metabacillus endolithicus]UPG66146.1 cytochrome c oxidase assembly protein [Metabacillus endolithicus]
MSFRRISLALLGLFFLLGPTGVFAHNGQKSGLHDYSFFELWNPPLFIGVISVFLLYLHFINKNRRGNPDFTPVSIKRKLSFLGGLIVFYIALGSPLHVLGDSFLFSAHMLAQSLVYIVMPPLLLMGLEKWMVQSVIKIGFKYKILSIAKVPLIPLLLFNILFSFYHIPIIFDKVVSNTIYHNLTHLILTATAFLMWLPIFPVSDELDKLSPLQKLGYIFGAGVLLTPACALIIFADEPLYVVYANAPQLWTYHGPLDDQQTGGIVMKVIQELIYGTVIGYIFFKWAKKEHIQDEYVPTINEG